jgi:hypothetical protein
VKFSGHYTLGLAAKMEADTASLFGRPDFNHIINPAHPDLEVWSKKRKPPSLEAFFAI